MGKAKLFSTFILMALVASLNLSCSAIKEGRPRIGVGYGAPVKYGEGRHPGLDYSIPKGTPIIACSDGKVVSIRERNDPTDPGKGGFYVFLEHYDEVSKPYYSVYAHLSEVFVSYFQTVQRGQLIGLSGESHNGYQHLHFGLVKTHGGGAYISNTYNPNKWGLDGGKPECFDPEKDYSKYPFGAITIPVACRKYKKILRGKIKNLEK
jgi:murein DD-endopeptidase MepM/ murein hydrolase activator NlpD